MDFILHKSFKKALRKQSRKVQLRFFQRIELFENDPFHPTLDNHALSGRWKHHRSIDITGDVRAVYITYIEIKGVAVFIDIGTHSQLY
ncbi:MAG: addiction module RelE/StbE family toxin [Planctomycetota bacterium]|jgi:addiction module RelE/StbE family toxin